MGELTKTEKYLLESQDLLETRGKGGIPVPLLIPKDCMMALDFLANAKLRHLVAVKTENKFLFANTSAWRSVPTELRTKHFGHFREYTEMPVVFRLVETQLTVLYRSQFCGNGTPGRWGHQCL